MAKSDVLFIMILVLAGLNCAGFYLANNIIKDMIQFAEKHNNLVVSVSRLEDKISKLKDKEMYKSKSSSTGDVTKDNE